MIKNENHTNLEKDLIEYKGFHKLGEGTYGVVFRAIDRSTNNVCAIKKVKMEDSNEGIPSTTLREISVLNTLKGHPNIVTLKDLIRKEKNLYMCFEYIDYDLKKFLGIHKNALPESIVKAYVYQLLLAIAFMHCNGILHRDLKPQNLLIDKCGTLKVADFGLARFIDTPVRPLTHEILTLWYRAPEILLGQDIYSTPVDIWSIGLIFFEIAHEGQPLFSGDSEIDQLFKIFKLFGTPDESTWKEFRNLPFCLKNFPNFKGEDLKVTCKYFNSKALDLFKKIMHVNPAKRIHAIDALNHPYFDDLDKESFFKMESLYGEER